MKEKKFIKINRIIFLAILLLNICLPIILSGFQTELEFLDFVYLFYYFIPVTILLFIQSLLLCYKKYEYNENVIEVYSGYYNNYIKINNEKYDEHKTLVTFSQIILSCTLDSGEKIQATISLTNRITLKLNDKLLQK